MSSPTPVFVCLKWGKGYPTIYTNTLYRALTDMMSIPFRFHCITDDPQGLDEGIETSAIPEFALERKLWTNGMFPKLSVFRAGLFEPGTPVMMVDVDVVVLQDLAPMVDHVIREGGLHIIADWPDTLERWFPRWIHVERLSNSSVVGFIAGEQDHLFEDFKDQDGQIIKAERNDQEFIHRHCHNRKFWPEGWVLSFKKSLAWHFPVNLVRPIARPTGYIVAFHGTPDPEALAQGPFKRWGSPEKFGYFPVKWVKKYWDRYARQLG